MKNIINISNIRYRVSLLVIFLGISLMANAQTTITGKVTDENNSGLPGANIMVKGTDIGTITDLDGEYTINITEDDTVLIFSFVGCVTQEVSINNQKVIDVKLLADNELDAIVVVGYGTMRKKDITGSIAVVDVDDLGNSQFQNVTDQLQGRVAGVSVVTTGQPGKSGEIKIRGTSFLGEDSNNPLYVVDGILTDDSPNLNPYDIESIQVLKDASSAAIYGSRAANGVIVITTKKGKSDKPTINFSATAGLQEIPNHVKMKNNVDFARINNAASDNGVIPRMTMADVDFDPTINTVWQDEMFRQGMTQDLNLSVSSGGEKYTAYFSINNSYNEGTIYGSLFDRTGIRVNTSFSPWKKLTVGQNVMVSQTRSSGLGGEEMTSIYGMLPIIPVYDPTRLSGYGHGELGVATSYNSNPKGEQDLNQDMAKQFRILGNIFMKWNIIEGLDYNFSLGVNSNFDNEKSYIPAGQIRMGYQHESNLTEKRNQTTEIFIENRLTYTKTFGKHNMSVMATHTEQKLSGTKMEGKAVNGHTEEPYFWVLGASTTPTVVTGSENTSVLRSFLGRLTYNYDDKYFLTGAIRHDGSSKFPKDGRWGTFPSASAGWNIANENFFNVDFIQNLKPRIGYGEVGNSSIDDYRFQSLVLSQSTEDGVNYNLGPNSALAIGATRGSLSNRAISWENKKETNFGIDISMFDGRLQLTGDYFMANLEGLLAEVPVVSSVGPFGTEDSPQVTINAVDMETRGWEASITYKGSFNDISFSTTLNAWHANNKIKTLPFGVDEFPGSNSSSRLGLPVGQLFLVEYLGVYTSQEQIDADGVTIDGQVPVVGDARYRDINGRDANGNLTGEPDGNISFDDDRQIWGETIPAVEFGWNFNAKWRGFDFYIFLQGMSKRDVFNNLAYTFNTNHTTNYTADYDPYIDGTGTDPRPNIGFIAANRESTRFVENGAYLRLKNLQLGYTIPWKKVKNLRVFVSGQNLLTFTKYKGMDPEFEVNNVFESGVDNLGYPQVRIYSAGINITL